MKATELANKLLDAAMLVGDYEVECRNDAGDLDYVETVYCRDMKHHGFRLVITTDRCDVDDEMKRQS